MASMFKESKISYICVKDRQADIQREGWGRAKNKSCCPKKKESLTDEEQRKKSGKLIVHRK